ncbi:MAG TPA: Lrp/AsnC family transcriptional regulator [Pseudomonas sp.]|uniref:Lrp/AsnC family transcriptional regulator n=1 Tax=Pseudomonas sp. TaxID=306 RepID=UPI002ED800C4
MTTTSTTSTAGLDRIDLAIIEVLRHEGRISYQKLSERVHLTPRPCLERVRKLEQRGFIRGYSAVVDEQLIAPGMSLRVMVALSNQSGRAAQRAFETCMRECAQVTECHLVSGAFDYSLRMHCRDMNHYLQVTEQWLNDPALYIDKLVSHPELTSIKSAIGPPARPNPL